MNGEPDEQQLEKVAYWSVLRAAARLTADTAILDLDPHDEPVSLALARRAQYLCAVQPSAYPFHWWRDWARDQGISSILHLNASAEVLPFRDHSFDVITCRFPTFRHTQLPGVLTEAKRLLRPGGRVLFGGLILPEEPRQASFIAALAQLWNPPIFGERTTYSLTEWAKLFSEAGLRYQMLTRWQHPLVTGRGLRFQRSVQGQSSEYQKHLQETWARGEQLDEMIDTASPDLVTAFSIQHYPLRAVLRPCALFGGWVR